MKRIKLQNGGSSLVDDEDFSFLTNGNFIWRLSSTGYAEDIKKRGGKANYTAMHRLINQTPNNAETDHINGNKLDNRKSNLRTVSAFENQWNREGIRGIYFHKNTQKWVARIMIKGERIHLGSFYKKNKAFEAYKIAVKQNYGKFGERR